MERFNPRARCQLAPSDILGPPVYPSIYITLNLASRLINAIRYV